MASKFGFKLTQKADVGLDDIVSYIAVELSNAKAATDFMDNLQDAIDEICAFPQSGSLVVNEFLPEIEIRKKLVDNYIMYYLPDFTEKLIFMLRIVYVRRNMDEILRYLDL
ncbi:hypothetical protein EUCA11A_33570 [Eubacterium callanderi]|uniref:type II toxin-antitoxin system RelE/ParE family toxin n=1 Tax=Eubacterium callanderi TaxID=53442 RepID=UPI0029FF5529|nr:type II toxin-antitoxin system RelE/ParE family toxin [Eubacterium callanderi]WPK69169.1 hypothetical protein EUCA2A_33570 [Eubacterium callanderi]WPK73467.1 hypothetical protein EUCA11A_33570 [Eubacterium callanderi]